VNIVNKIAFGILIALSVIGAAYFISGSRQEKLQANVYTKAGEGEHFPDLAKTCPNQVADFGDADEADYTFIVRWRSIQPKGWFYFLERKDGATLGLLDLNARDPNAARVARQVCRDIARDFPLWLNTQRVRASIGKPSQTGTVTSVEDDPPRRYEMMEYRNGPIIGQALLDTKLGRLWTLTNIVNSAGKTVRTEFQENGVENLWKSEDEAPADLALWRVKKLTRPAAIQRAEEQAEKER
jgi:hypothetical protein